MSLPAKTSAVRPGARLKHPTGWFAAGGEVSRALQLLSDGAFKLYMHLCLKADRSTGQYKGDSVDLVKALGKSRRSVVVYLEESLQNTVRQESARTGSDRDLRRLLALRKATSSGEAAKPGGVHGTHPPSAGGPVERQVPIETIEHRILMACTRKYMTLLTTPNSGLIVSFSYFRDAIEQAAASKVSNDYWRYLRHSIDGLEKEWLQKVGLTR